MIRSPDPAAYALFFEYPEMVVGTGRSRHTETDFPQGFAGVAAKITKTKSNRVVQLPAVVNSVSTAEGFSWAV
jgi:hypothetical protein